uniref:HAT C-terminal dimerisation domain-containing protein n=1 Tax=Panagrolaimus sp. PS1159 TaxID=55785 RepID=A0AC35GPA3_9BILA
MSIKNDKYSFIEQSFTTSENQYYNLDLNQYKKCSILVPVQSYSKSNNDEYCSKKKFDNYKEKEKLHSWNKESFTTFNDDNDGFKKQWKNKNTLKSADKSTLSLYIAAYENSIEAAVSDLVVIENIKGLKREKFGSIKTSKQSFTDAFKPQNPFEFPRQQNENPRNEPQIMQFRTSQRLNRDETEVSRPSPQQLNVDTPKRKSMNNLQKKEIVNNSDEIEWALKTAALLALQEKVPVLHDFHYFAVILDPNAKKRINSFLLEDRYKRKRTLEDIIEKLKVALKSYIIKTRRYRPRATTAAPSDNPFAGIVSSTQQNSTDVILNDEMDKYLLDDEQYTTSITGYWKNATHYPYLASFAKHILSIPASSCPLERSFSVLNKVDSKDRPQQNQETITNIVLCNAIEKNVKAAP